MELMLVRRIELTEAPINQNDLALAISKKEGGKKSMDIAQIKEVQRLLIDELRRLAKANPQGVAALIFGKDE